MSDFTFLCPSCHQQIQASSEHSGMEVDCPLCQTKIVIPAAPDTPGVPQARTKLSMAASTAEHKPQGFAPPPPARKKKSKFPPKTIAGVVVATAAIIAGIHYGPRLYDQYKQKQADKEAAELAASQPPPPPPEPSAAEIVRQMGDKYKAMSTFSAQGQTAATLDMSELAPNNPSAKSISLTANTALRFGRPDLYRLEWTLQAGQATVGGAAWSAGKGNFFAAGPYPSKVKNRETAFSEAAGSSGTIGMTLAALFFNDQNNPAAAPERFAKTNGTALNGQDCYIVAGDDNAARLELWVNKKTYLVAQAEVYLNGGLDQDAYKAQTNSTIKAQMLRVSKIHGSITETYQNIAVDTPIAAADFEKSALGANAMMNAAPAPEAPMTRRRPGQSQ